MTAHIYGMEGAMVPSDSSRRDTLLRAGAVLPVQFHHVSWPYLLAHPRAEELKYRG